jgi:hypothetical protein
MEEGAPRPHRTMKGSRPGKLPQPSPTEEPARTCSAPGCVTTLSIYNLTSKCWQHADLKFPTYRGKRLAQGEA